MASVSIYSVSASTSSMGALCRFIGRRFLGSVALLLGLWLMAPGAYAQLYYVVRDNVASTRTDELRRINYDGTNNTLVATNFADVPGMVAIDPAVNKAFVCEARVTVDPKIISVDLTTGSSTTLVSLTSFSGCSGIALDRVNQYIYYTVNDGVATTRTDQLRRVRYDGTGDQLVITNFVDVAGPLSFDPANNRIFALDARGTAAGDGPDLVVVNLTNNTAASIFSTTAFSITSIAYDSRTNKLYYTRSDAVAATSTDPIYRINPDGTGDEQVVANFGLNSPGSIAVDKVNNLLFVSDTRASAPELLKIDLGTLAVSSVTSSPVSNTATFFLGGGGIALVPTCGTFATSLIPSPSNTLTCAQTTLTLTASGGGTYVFRGPSGVLSGSGNTRTISAPGTYSVIVTDLEGCTALSTTTITSNTTPPTAQVSPTSIALTCQAPTASLTATGGGTYRWDDNSTNAIRTVNTANTYSVTVTGTNGCTATASSTVNTNFTPPGANLTASGTISCTATSVTLTATSTSGQTFAFSPGVTGIGSTGPTSRTAVVTTAGPYSITITGANGCTSTAAVTVTGSTTAPTASISTPSNLSVLDCNTTVLTLTASGGDTYLWDNGQQTASRNVSATGVYSVTVTGTNGCTATASKTISQNITPPPVSLTATDVCAGQSLTLTATSGIGNYTFVGGSGLISSGSQNSTTVSGLTAGPQTFTVLVRSSVNSCTNIATATATVNAGPTATLTASRAGGPPSSTLTCAQTSLTLTATGGTSYTFAGPGGAGIVSSDPVAGTAVVNAAGTYTVTVGNGTGCTSSTTVSISSDQATPTLTISASPSTTLTCASTSLTLTATTSGTGVVWSTAESTSSITVNTANTYSVTATGANGCSSMTSVVVSSNTTAPGSPALTASNSGTLTCAVPSLTLTATATGTGLTYLFTGPGGGLVGIVSQNAASGTAVVNAPGAYSVVVTGSNGCTATASTVISQSVTLPTPTLTASPSSTLTCAVSSLTLTATGGNMYAFARVGGGAGLMSQNAASGTAVVNASGTYSVTVTNTTTGCFSITTLAISQNIAAPSATLTPTSVSVCAPGSVTLTAPGGATNYAFSGPGGFSQNGSGNSTTISQSGNYTVIVTGINGCTATGTSSVTIQPRPSAPTLTPGATFTTLTSNTPFDLTGLVQPATPPNTLAFYGTGGLLNPPRANVSNVGIQSFSVVQVSAFGCLSLPTPFSLTVISPLPPASQSSCRGSAVVLSVQPTGVRYEWYKNGQTAANKLINVLGVQQGATTASLTLVSVQTNATYYAKVFAADGSFSWFGPFAVVIANCGGRMGTTEVALTISLQPNPLENGQLRAIVTGAGGQPLTVQLYDSRGYVIRQNTWELADHEQLIHWDVATQPGGVYLLRAVSHGQQKMTKVLKP
ncbi:T9SS type A sorting domain-containing protein [Fibrella aquatilis]|uniref:T9SS type A sorting domain-containing protein n=1 Tax=Fibrella aquatilis TaxID=2817059 RepID=A0A939JXC0_9BACT|nr:T9SS type A sorting domain-containing protein [Fibrella aquatilis]MBO0930879.1 T9SS type A sorting domain-containing protein [Fibrella aquatilis]